MENGTVTSGTTAFNRYKLILKNNKNNRKILSLLNFLQVRRKKTAEKISFY